jgi:preprotein translocase subunit SecA
MNQQREVVYDRRRHALIGKNLKGEILQIIDEIIESSVNEFTDPKTYPEEWDLVGLKEKMAKLMLLRLDISPDKISSFKQEELIDRLKKNAHTLYEKKEEIISSDLMRKLERLATLRIIDERWKEHLYEMDQLKEGIGLRAYGQKDPLIEYKREGYNLFVNMINRTNEEIVELIFKAQIAEEAPSTRRMPAGVVTHHASASGMGYSTANQQQENQPSGAKKRPVRVEVKVGRNDPCPCGSGKKYKKCCGKNL